MALNDLPDCPRDRGRDDGGERGEAGNNSRHSRRQENDAAVAGGAAGSLMSSAALTSRCSLQVAASLLERFASSFEFSVLSSPFTVLMFPLTMGLNLDLDLDLDLDLLMVTPAHACRMTESAGSTWLGCGHGGGRYFYFQSIIFHFTTNCRMS